VKQLGGTKDGGIDGYILKGDKLSTIIQVKWRQDIDRAEAVSVVREVGGTLLSRGAPNGILVSNRKRFSRPAIAEAAAISNRHETELGKLSLSLIDYQNILDMLEFSNRKLSNRMTTEDLWDIHSKACVFDGAAKISEDFVKAFLD